MSTTVQLVNLRATTFAHPEVTVAPLATKSKVFKQVNADDYAVNYDLLAGFGVAVSENGTLRPGAVVITGAATLTNTQKLAIVDTDGPGFTLGLPAASGLPDGHRIWIYMRTDGGGNLTVDGAGGDTVLGAANQVLTAAGQVLRLQLEGTNWKAQTV